MSNSKKNILKSNYNKYEDYHGNGINEDDLNREIKV